MKKRRKRQRTKVARAELSTDALLKQGETQLLAGHYREAIDTYKQVLKREQHPQCLAALAKAYLGRGGELAAKGMYKEAAALWENMAGVCDTREGVDLYLNWLFHSGRWPEGLAKAARMFTDADDVFRESSEGQRFAALLAGLLASGQSEIAQALPGDTPLVQHLTRITGALQAFCQGDDAALKEHLKSIPYRSPYRDLRSILQALAIVATDPDALATPLGKIPADSPFSPLAAWVRIAALDGESLLEAVADMESGARGFVLTLKGWSEAQIELADELLSSRDKRAPSQALFKLVTANSELFGKAEAQRVCVSLLPDYPAGRAAYEQQFGALPALEWERLSALVAERQDNLFEAIRHWEHYVELLEQQHPRGEEETLKAALVLRHLADLSIQLNGPDPWNEEVPDYLARSLELDPEDRDSYLKLMTLTDQQDDSRAHGRWVEQAMRHFPADPDIVMAAVMAAYRRGAFKKAAGFARSLLKRDPINRSARNMLLSSHLGHARKQINAGKFTLAIKELDTAAEFTQDDEQRGVVGLIRGFLTMLSGSKETGMALLQQAYKNLGEGLVAHFRFLVDGQRLEIDQHTLGKYFNQIKTKSEAPATKQDILSIVDFINRYVSDGVKDIADILERLLKPLKAASKLDYAEKELQGICDALERADHHGLLRAYAEAGLKQWGHRPAFVYYSTVGRTNGWPDRMTSIDHIEMQTAFKKAIEEEDHQTIGRIERFLGLPDFGLGPMPLLPPGAPPDMEEAIEDLLDEFGPEGVEEVMDALEDIIFRGDLGIPGRRKGRRR